MRAEKAIQFIPDLLGDIPHVLSLSKNQTQFIIESCLNLFDAACNVYRHISVKQGNKQYMDLLKQMELENQEQKNLHIEQFQEEVPAQMRNEYEKLRVEIEKGKATDETIRRFASFLRQNLDTVFDGINKAEVDPEDQWWDEVQELLRQKVRDYNRLTELLI